MIKILYLGDPHVKPNNLKESEDLLTFVTDKALEYRIDRLEILGDLWDTHDLVRLSVTEFWDRWFNKFSKEFPFKTIVLVGNHDQSGSYTSNYSALHPFISLESKNFKIVTEPYFEDRRGYLPYVHDNEKYIEKANGLADKGATVLVSHHNFQGAIYDNGSPISNGVDPDRLDSRFLHLIGGHIHTERAYDRVWYVGNPRWLTKSCANKQKGFWISDCNSDSGAIVSKEFVSTESVCTPIISLVWREGQDKPEIPANAKVDIELHGSSDWIAKQKPDLKGVSVSSKFTDTKKSKTRKSGKSFYEFLSSHYQAEPQRREKLISYLKGLQLV